ncbi:hypothetical protein BDR03DRAFT_951051 [Suillus americanus]|nr:hypothetical protein BDR03DRAFT_951051 [Suillus americanus]
MDARISGLSFRSLSLQPRHAGASPPTFELVIGLGNASKVGGRIVHIELEDEMLAAIFLEYRQNQCLD